MPSGTNSVVETIVNVVSNAGAMGILAILVCHLGPKWMKEVRGSRESDLKQRREELAKSLDTFRGEARYEREQCQRQFDQMMDQNKLNQDMVVRAFDSISDQIRAHHDFTKTSIELMRAKS